ncbi:hypothetical protein [Nocardia wallacei]|uniref:hypothetical protein n=1 Tax=Nocardia wallacei TaxID=480035 RepID=UPI002454D859|nr:hypothetical protein [Nocardia wallacei]
MTTGYETSGLGASMLLLALRLPVPLRPAVGELRYEGGRSGRRFALPVSYVRTNDSVVVRVGHAATTMWWHDFRARHPASIRVDGRWLTGTGRVVLAGSLEHEEVEAIYQGAHPRNQARNSDPYVVIDVDRRRVPQHGKRTGRRWFVAVVLGGFLGFLAPVVASAVTSAADPGVTAAAIVLAGGVEGVVLGRFQATVLRSAVPRLRTGRWVAATVAGVMVAWAMGLIPMWFGERIARWPNSVQVPFVVTAGLVMVFSVGVAQWNVLRHFTDRAELWIWANAVGWIAGLVAFAAVTVPLWEPGQSAGEAMVLGALGGSAIAVAVAAVTGAFLPRVLNERHLLSPV